MCLLYQSKVKPVEELKKQLRPVSLTPRLSNVAEQCVILDYVKPAVLDVLDPSQYGAVPNSSTTQALIHMLHNWSKEPMATALQLELFSLTKKSV